MPSDTLLNQSERDTGMIGGMFRFLQPIITWSFTKPSEGRFGIAEKCTDISLPTFRIDKVVIQTPDS
jgi:hypothetical protein